jgi:hypothetical protein
MTGSQNRGRIPPILVESTLTRPMYARILFLLGIRSWGFVLLAAVFLYLVWWSINIGNYTLLAIYAGLLVLIYIGAVLVSVLTPRNRRAYFPVKYTFGDSGITKETASVTQSFKWNTVVRWRRIGSYYLIYMTRRSFFVIPKAKIPAGKTGNFENLLGKYIVRRRAKFGLR